MMAAAHVWLAAALEATVQEILEGIVGEVNAAGIKVGETPFKPLRPGARSTTRFPSANSGPEDVAVESKPIL